MHGLVLMIQCLYGIFEHQICYIGNKVKRALLFICIWLNQANHHSGISAMTHSTSGRHRKLSQLQWANMSAHLTKETFYWRKKLLMHLNWAIYDVCDLNIDPHVCFFPTLSQDRGRPIPLAQPEACRRRSERPVCARSPHRSRNGYPGCVLHGVKALCFRNIYDEMRGLSTYISVHLLTCFFFY